MLIWLIFFLPETKHRTLEECTSPRYPFGIVLMIVDEMFAQKLPAWKFKGYKCVGIENAQEVQERMEAKGLEFGEKGTVRHAQHEDAGHA
jgi:hypothetical protein